MLLLVGCQKMDILTRLTSPNDPWCGSAGQGSVDQYMVSLSSYEEL